MRSLFTRFFQLEAASGLLLMPMAGLAIGLVNTTVALFPREGLIVGSTVLAAVAILAARQRLR